MSDKFLILGTLPPPIGGVTIHVACLLKLLDNNKLKYSFLPLKRPLKILLFDLWGYSVVHLHCSNVYFRLIFSLWCFFLRKKLIITYHGNIGRYNKLKNILDLCSVYFAYIPIVLNDNSLNLVRRFNKKARLISSFLPPQQLEYLPQPLEKQIDELRNNYVLLCSTNASAVSHDKNHDETYGITALIEFFEMRKDNCLLISDPSGQYIKYINEKNINLPINVIFLSFPHSYYALLKKVDCMIRNTTTDGDALSIKEALFLGKIVYATDVVDRHPAVNVYHSLNELNTLLDHTKVSSNVIDNLSGEKELLSLYKKLGCRKYDNS